MTQKTALITGVTGQDGALLARFLLQRGYRIHGMRPYAASDDCDRLRDGPLADPCFHLHHGDLADGGNLLRLLHQLRPDEIYNLGAQSHVGASFTMPEHTANVNALGTLRLLESLRVVDPENRIRFYQASSSEMFGNAPAPQDENTYFMPCSPYGAAKLYAYWVTRNYRDAYGVHASNGILFNHESPLRGEEFVTRKIARHAARRTKTILGNLDAKRDWGHADDYVRGMWMILQQDRPDDFVLATGVAHSVRDFCMAAYDYAGIALDWVGEGVAETGRCRKSGKVFVEIDPALFRPAELHHLVGNAAKAERILGWKPEISFHQLVAGMVDAEQQEEEKAGGWNDKIAAE